MTHYVIPSTVLQAILAYLETRPYREVAQGIEQLRALPEIKPAEVAPAPSSAKEA